MSCLDLDPKSTESYGLHFIHKGPLLAGLVVQLPHEIYSRARYWRYLCACPVQLMLCSKYVGNQLGTWVAGMGVSLCIRPVVRGFHETMGFEHGGALHFGMLY